MSDGPLTDQQGVPASLKQSSPNQSVSSEPSENEERPWSASKIAENIVGRIARYKWLPKSGRRKPTDPKKELEKVSSSSEVQDGGGIEYTSEHLEKALIELKFSTSKIGTTLNAPSQARETINERKTETVETCVSRVNLSGTAMSTDISYSVNLKRSDQSAEIKPIVENMSTQSSADTVQFDAHTTRDDFKAVVTSEMLSNALLNVTANVQNDGLEESKSNTDADHHSKKSKVPVLKPDHLSCPSSSVNLTKVGKVNQKLSGSKIPLRLTGSSTSHKEKGPSGTSLSLNRAPLHPQNVSRANVEIDKSALSEIVFQPRANLSKVKEDTSVMNVIQLNSFEETKLLSKLATHNQPRQSLEITQNENKENTIMRTELQNEETPSCDGNNREANNKLNSDSDVKCQLEQEAFNSELMATCIKTDHADSTTTEIGIKQDVDKIKSTETLEDDDEYEDYDEEEELENDKITEMPEPVQKTSQKCGAEKNLARESKTCLMGPSPSVISNRNKGMPGLSETRESEESDTSTLISERDSSVQEQISSTASNVAICVKAKISAEKVQKKTPSELDQSNSVPPIDINEIRNLSPEDIAFEVNVFNMIQSQKINNILRMAMPYNSILLPIFVSSPTAIMHALDYEVRSTMEIKRKASVYYSELKRKINDAPKPVVSNVKKSPDKIVSSSSRTGVPIWKPVSVSHDKRKEPSKSKPKTEIKSPGKARSATETTAKKSTIRPSYIYYGAIIGPQIMAKHKTLWIPPPYYYGTNKPVLAK